MAFGGYKFKGYKVVRANLATNTYANWCLLVHQARIKAFMESCALSGAQWHFSKTNGALAFENYGNVIYRVANANGEYHDYLSFFQYGDEELYYMIATLGELYFSSSFGTPVVNSGANYSSNGSASTAAYRKFLGISSALSLSQFTDTGPFGDYPANALPCSSCLTDCVNAGTTNISGSYNTYEGQLTGHALGLSTIYAGYATKGKDIISFGPYLSQSNFRACVESGDAFGNMCDPNDNKSLLKVVLGIFTNERNSTPSAAQSNGFYLINFGNCETLTSQGLRSNYSTNAATSASSLVLTTPTAAIYSSANQSIFFEAPFVTSIGSDKGALNSGGCYAKGSIKTELLATNAVTDVAQLPQIGSTALAENLLTARIPEKTAFGSYVIGSCKENSSNATDSGTTLPVTIHPVYYVGWDPSNPNILNESSWPELALQ